MPALWPKPPFAHKMLCFGWSRYDARAVLGVYPLHLSAAELFELLETAAIIRGDAGDRSMAEDLLAPICNQVVVYDTSKKMIEIAAKCVSIFAVHSMDVCTQELPDVKPGEVDLLFLLNVLDRTTRPRTLLERVRSYMSADGLCVIATPLPFKVGYFDSETFKQYLELLFRENINSNDDWEWQVASFMLDVLPKVGL